MTVTWHRPMSSEDHMVNDDLCWTPATTLAAMIRTKKISPVEVIDAMLARIATLNPRLNAYVVVLADEARTQAKAAERAVTRRSAKLGPLHGVPYSVKDLVITNGVRTTFGTPLYRASAAWSLSHIGPMTRTVADAALMMNVCAGPDERDQYSLPSERVDYLKALRGSLEGLRVAYTDDLGFAEAIDPEVRAECAK